MPVTIENLLGYPQLIDLIQTVKSGIPRVLPDQFFNLTRNVITDYASYRKILGTRRLPKASQYGAPSRAAPKQDISEVPVKLIHTIENQQFGQLILQLLGVMQPGGNPAGFGLIPQRLAEDEVARQTVEFKRRFENLRTAAVTGAIANGKIWLAADGTFLFSSSGAAVTINFGIPTANVGTATALLGSGFITWATATADILGALIALKAIAVKTTGFPLKYAFYGSNVLKYMMNNTAASNLIIRNPAFNNAFLNTGDIPGGFQELQWVPVYDAFAEDDTGTVQTFFDPDTIVFTPDITTEWYELLQGSYAILGGPDVYTGGVAADVLRGASMPYGQFSYATRTNDPIGVKQVMGDTFLPVIKNPNVVYSMKVAF